MTGAIRIERLRPSDVLKIKEFVEKGTVSDVLAALRSYFLALKNPSASQLDDVARVAAQLRTAGLWKREKPQAFVLQNPSLDRQVVEVLQETLGFEVKLPPRPQHTSLARAGTVLVKKGGRIFELEMGKAKKVGKIYELDVGKVDFEIVEQSRRTRSPQPANTGSKFSKFKVAAAKKSRMLKQEKKIKVLELTKLIEQGPMRSSKPQHRSPSKKR